MDLSLSTYHPVLVTSEMYADLLNSSSISNHIVKLLGGRRGMLVAPYTYIDSSSIEYEEYSRADRKYSNELTRVKYSKKVKLSNSSDISNVIAPAYRDVLPRNYDRGVCGLIGVPLGNYRDDKQPQDHYISYVYAKGVLHYFDSAINDKYEKTETYQILCAVFKPDIIVANTKTFETEGGNSKNPYSYIAQNIFCHTWSLWFLYVFIVEGKSMKDIDRVAGKGSKADKVNLIRIKSFIFKVAIKQLELDVLFDFNMFDSFRYIIEDENPECIKEVVRY